jgi:hypothetical protein
VKYIKQGKKAWYSSNDFISEIMMKKLILKVLNLESDYMKKTSWAWMK